MSVAPALILSKRREGRIRPQLVGLRDVLAKLGDPQQKFPSILVVGTNGKGSTAAMLEAVLRAHGLTTGLYTSPHLVQVVERIRLDGRVVDGEELGVRLGRLEAFPDLTFFETLTAAAFGIFADARVEVAVLEAGMGGSWDATRLAESSIAGLTNVGSDHGAWLGNRRREIACDKGRALAAADSAFYSSGLARELVDDLDALNAVDAQTLVRAEKAPGCRIRLSWQGADEVLRMPLAGDHQLQNVELALALAGGAVAAGLLPGLDPDAVRRGLESIEWPGRLSTHMVAGRKVLVDCAHNLEATVALAHELSVRPERYNLLFSCLDDKPVEGMAEMLRPYVNEVSVCSLADERVMSPSRLQAAFPGASAAASPLEGLGRLVDPVLATGSVRLVGELLAIADQQEIAK
ncbi:MAG: folylpolyglutamate synthase/dihydrofolate synthase family protein [Thermoanaerobaculales bacterium]